MKIVIALVLFVATAAVAQSADPSQGLGDGYAGELGHVSRQLVALAEAIPPEKYAWRPAPGVRSTGEVFMHIASASFYLLSLTGQPEPADFKDVDPKKVATDKPKVIEWLKRALDAVDKAHAAAKPADLERKATFIKHEVTADGIYLRILVHANEHMGQLVAYARMNGVVPPWSK